MVCVGEIEESKGVVNKTEGERESEVEFTNGVIVADGFGQNNVA